MQKFLKKINDYQEKMKPFSLGIYEVNLKNLEQNIQKIRAHAEKIKGKRVKYLLPVKGAGYGCGMVQVSEFVQKKNLCEYLGVAHVQEAFELRKSGITMPILILGQTSCEENFLDLIAEQNIEIALSDEKFLEKIEENYIENNQNSEKNSSNQKKTSVHLKLDLGMGRCGVLEEDSLSLFKHILNSEAVSLKGVMMHFPVSDSENKKDKEFTESQIQKFLKIKEQMRNLFCRDVSHTSKKTEKYNFDEIMFHCANSGATLEHASAVKDFDIIRPGIASYGYPEPGKNQKVLGLKPVVQVYSHFTLIKDFPENFSIGYGRTYFTSRNEKIAIMPIGYADGLNRGLSNKYSVFSESGEKFHCVGRISMDQSAYRVPEDFLLRDDTLQKFFILGSNFNARELAQIINTISYEVLINLGSSERLRKTWVY